MNSLILLAALSLSGPPVDISKRELTILVASWSRNEEVKRRSVIASKEPFINNEGFFPELYFYLHHNFDVKIKEQGLEDIVCPAFKVGKNGPWTNLVETYLDTKDGRLKITAFNSSGSFIQTLVSMLKWSDFLDELTEWERIENEVMWGENLYYANNQKWMYYPPTQDNPIARSEGVLIGTYKIPMYLKYQRPLPPFIYPPHLSQELEDISDKMTEDLDAIPGFYEKEDTKVELLSKIDPYKRMLIDAIVYYLDRPANIKIENRFYYSPKDTDLFPREMIYGR